MLNCKIVCKDGKRSTDRSWRPAWAVLKKIGALFLCKEKKDNIMIPSVDSYPIDLKHAAIQVAYDYTKRKNVFKVNTFSNSEYLFQTCDHESMMEWIRAMQENSAPPDMGKLFAASKYSSEEFNPAAYQQNSHQSNRAQFHQRQQDSQSWDAAMGNNSSLNSLNEQHSISSGSDPKARAHMAYSSGSMYNKSINNSTDLMAVLSPDDLYLNNSQMSNQNMSPMHLRKG